MPFLYILQSEKTGRYYVGSTNDLKRRLNEHNSGQTRSLSHQRPLMIVFFQEYETMLLARRAEAKLKNFKSRKILDRIIKEGKINKGP
ncbi:GIY-YIG nuclease family protein [Patescibacteria group bacterium]|nr:GIY-YIG nuclease family protein [Patescibacteria group bacterium]